jgi:hypothetical protein
VGFKIFMGLMLAAVVGLGALAVQSGRKFKPPPPTPEELALQEKSREFLDLYKAIEDDVVRQPTRPMADFEQPILKLHYLWLDVRDNAYWSSRPADRAKIDSVVTKLVSDVTRDKQLRQAASGD